MTSLGSEQPNETELTPRAKIETYPTTVCDEHDCSIPVMLAELVVRRAFGRWAISAGVPERSANAWSRNDGQLVGDFRQRILAAAQRELKEVRYPEDIWDNSK